ncbi:MAG: 4-hydroxy-3-methylbut-2-enyl diphosphate reductase [Sterolibacterium sp.]|nr:4-hydroxy-3-methylbut-2-enyl diphosphate reductase [Sterolibacterium sp.]MBP9799359.1 4-hydroxy-3-methylbut-2-enyl diphosphate reductase [Sterolibacterium sp.]
MDTRQVLLANPRGFCAGVERAITIVERALNQFGAPIYVHHEVVHNRHVVEDLRTKGAIFVDALDEVPAGATLVFSAHGVSKAISETAAARGFRIFDATCPLVTKVHLEVAKMHREEREIIMIGHRGHPEVEGTMGQINGGIHLVETLEDVARLAVQDATRLSYVTQTTLSADDAVSIIEALTARFPAIQGPKKSDICYATQNRQDAVKRMTEHCDLIIVVGSPNSSNSNRLREVAQNRGVTAWLVDHAGQIEAGWLSGKTRIGVTAGASAPEILVQNVLQRLAELGATGVIQLEGATEDVTFRLPKELDTPSP